jgi:hypothetical protein
MEVNAVMANPAGPRITWQEFKTFIQTKGTSSPPSSPSSLDRVS